MSMMTIDPNFKGYSFVIYHMKEHLKVQNNVIVADKDDCGQSYGSIINDRSSENWQKNELYSI